MLYFMARKRHIANISNYGSKRNAHLGIAVTLFTKVDVNQLNLAKDKIKKLIRGITDFCAADKYTYQNPSRCSKVYPYSEPAWEMRNVDKCSGLVGDHAIPLEQIVSYLSKKKRDEPEWFEDSIGENNVRKFLENNLQIVMITKDEDTLLNQRKLKSKMPDNWDWGGDKYARYDYVGIQIKNKSKSNSLKIETN